MFKKLNTSKNISHGVSILLNYTTKEIKSVLIQQLIP